MACFFLLIFRSHDNALAPHRCVQRNNNWKCHAKCVFKHLHCRFDTRVRVFFSVSAYVLFNCIVGAEQISVSILKIFFIQLKTTVPDVIFMFSSTPQCLMLCILYYHMVPKISRTPPRFQVQSWISRMSLKKLPLIQKLLLGRLQRYDESPRSSQKRYSNKFVKTFQEALSPTGVHSSP